MCSVALSNIRSTRKGIKESSKRLIQEEGEREKRQEMKNEGKEKEENAHETDGKEGSRFTVIR